VLEGLTNGTPCTHEMRLGSVIGSGTSSVVFSVDHFLRCQASSKQISASVVAKVSKRGMDEGDTQGAQVEASILSTLPQHLNVVGYHGLFCSERCEELESWLGSFTRRSTKKPDQCRVVSSSQAVTSTSQSVLKLRTPSDCSTAVSELPDQNLPRRHLFTLQERCDRSLKELLTEHSFSEAELAFTVSSILNGLAHIHKLGVFHRDLTDGNLLIADGGRRVVLCDFDLSVQTAGASEVAWRCGTPGFVAPEVLTKRLGSSRSDVFSAGVVAFYVACGTHAFIRDSYKATAHATIHEEADFWGGHVLQRSNQCLSFIDSMMCKQALLRPTATEGLRSSWLQEARIQDLWSALHRPRRKSTVSLLRDNAEDVAKAPDVAAEKAKARSYWTRLAAAGAFLLPSKILKRKPQKRVSEHRLAKVVPA